MSAGQARSEKPRLRAVVFANESKGMAPPLMEKFRQEFEIVEVISNQLSAIYRTLFLVLSFRLPKEAWYRRWMRYLEKTPFVFKAVTKRNAEHLRRLEGKYDIIIMFGAMNAPSFQIDKPLFIITDSTRSLSARNMDDQLSHFHNAKEKSEWFSLEGAVYRAAGRLFVGSNFVKNSMVTDYGIPSERVIVAGFGPGIGLSDVYEKHFDGRTVLFIGKGDFEKKGGKLLLEAFAEVRRDIPDAVLHIVGQERIPYAEGVINHGFVTDRAMLRELMQAAHVFVLPSLVDRNPITILEAMAAITPCISTDYGAIPELVGDAGLIVRRNDVQELAQAMKQVLTDQALARKLGKNGRRRYEEKYNWTRIWEVMRIEMQKALDEERDISVTTQSGDQKLPLVSVIIPTFNAAHFLGEAINSILQQTYPQDRIEIIVVDDGSTDNTRDVIAHFGPRVDYSYQTNQGQMSAMQAGINRSHGSIVALLDADDYWYADKMMCCVPIFNNPYVIAVLHDLDILEHGKLTGKTYWDGKVNILSGVPQDLLRAYLDGAPINAITSGTLWRRSLLDKILPVPPLMKAGPDVYFIRHSIFFGKVCGINRALGVYRLHEANIYGAGGANIQDFDGFIFQTQISNEAFNRRCQQFGIGKCKRMLVQQHALSELLVKKHRQQSLWSAVQYVMGQVPILGFWCTLQLLASIALPRKVAMLLNRYVFRHLGVPV